MLLVLEVLGFAKEEAESTLLERDDGDAGGQPDERNDLGEAAGQAAPDGGVGCDAVALFDGGEAASVAAKPVVVLALSLLFLLLFLEDGLPALDDASRHGDGVESIEAIGGFD